MNFLGFQRHLAPFRGLCQPRFLRAAGLSLAAGAAVAQIKPILSENKSVSFSEGHRGRGRPGSGTVDEVGDGWREVCHEVVGFKTSRQYALSQEKLLSVTNVSLLLLPEEREIMK